MLMMNLRLLNFVSQVPTEVPSLEEQYQNLYSSVEICNTLIDSVLNVLVVYYCIHISLKVFVLITSNI